jgi:predicted enzyme related to lactoylglutathione lyase
MMPIPPRFVGVELYFENLEKAKKFYVETLGLQISDEQAGITQNSILAQASFALNGRGLSRTRRKIRRFSSLRSPASSQQ